MIEEECPKGGEHYWHTEGWCVKCEQYELDKCSRCKGARGGVPGNENVMPDGTILCDYCHADDLFKETTGPA